MTTAWLGSSGGVQTNVTVSARLHACLIQHLHVSTDSTDETSPELPDTSTGSGKPARVISGSLRPGGSSGAVGIYLLVRCFYGTMLQ